MKSERGIAALLVAGLLALAACGSDDGSSAEAGSATTSKPTAATGSPPPASSSPASSVATSAGGGSVDSSKPPVLVGFHNLEGGQYSQPDIRQGFEAAVRYINDEQGGINGHELTVSSCQVDLVPETSVNCANQFVDDGVVMAVQGIDYTGDAGLPVLQQAGIIDVSALAYGPAANVAQGDFFAANYSIDESMAAGLVMLKGEGATKVAEVVPNIPSMVSNVTTVVEPAADKLGIELEPVYYDQPADWATIAATIVALQVDAVNMFAIEADCLAAIPALRSAGFTGPIVAGVCVQPLAELDVDLLENVYIGASVYSPVMEDLPAKVQDDLDLYQSHVPTDLDQFQAMQGWGIALFAASILRQVPGEFTAATVRSTAATATGELAFRVLPYDCGAPSWPGTTACSRGFIYGKATPDRTIALLPDQPTDVSSILPAS